MHAQRAVGGQTGQEATVGKGGQLKLAVHRYGL